MLQLSPYTILAEKHGHLLLFNTLTRAVAKVENTTASQFKDQLVFAAADGAPWERLIQNGHITEQPEQEFNRFLSSYRSRRHGPQRLVLYITPTLKCNASCEYCFQRDVRPIQSPLLKGPSIPSVIDFIVREMHHHTGLKITWFGGEPLFARSYIKEASKHFVEISERMNKPYFASIITNALLLDGSAVKLLRDSRVSHLQVSLDGPSDLHDRIGRKDGKHGFHAIVENLSALPRDFRVALRVNVSRKNASRIPDLIDELAQAGLNDERFVLDFPLVYDYSISKESLAYQDTANYTLPHIAYGPMQLKLQQYAASLGFRFDPDHILIPGSSQCHAVREGGYSIWPDGSITKCIHDISTPEGIKVENGSALNKIASSSKWTLKEFFSEDPCRSCFNLPLCGGSCMHGRELGHHPPFACPPSKHTLPDRLTWYDDLVSSVKTLRIDRAALVGGLKEIEDAL